MNASTTTRTASLLAVTLAGTLAATAAPAPKPVPSPSLVPAHVGQSVSFHYDSNENGPRGSGGTHAVLTLTRIVNDRVAVTIGPDEGAASAVVGRIGSDGALRFDAADARRREANTGGGARQPDSDVPMDGPIGGLPGGAGPGQGQAGQGQAGQGDGQTRTRGQYGARTQQFGTGAAARIEVPASVRVLSALIGARPAGSPHSWPFSVGFGSEPGVGMVAKLERTSGTEMTVVADGSGDVRLPGVATAPAQPTASQDGNGGYGRRRGGAGGGQGMPGGGIPGQGGSGQGGYGRGQGGYGQGQGQAPAGYAAPQAVPATATLHVESTFRNGRLVLAHGSETMVAHPSTGATGDATTSVRWTLTAL